MQRHLLGIIAIVLLAVGAVAFGTSQEALAGTCLRVAAVLGLLWLALPQLRDVPLWLSGAIGMTLLVVMRFPKLLLAVLPLAVVLWLLRPRKPRN